MTSPLVEITEEIEELNNTPLESQEIRIREFQRFNVFDINQ